MTPTRNPIHLLISVLLTNLRGLFTALVPDEERHKNLYFRIMALFTQLLIVLVAIYATKYVP